MTEPDDARRWLLHSLDLAAASVTAAGTELADCGVRPLRQVKVYAEAALLSRAAGPALVATADAQLHVADERLRTVLVNSLDADRARFTVAMDPATFVDQVFPYALLGVRDDGLRNVARELARLAFAAGLGDEASPFDRIERGWLLGLLDDTAPAASASGSVLARGADLMRGDLTAAYAFTHAIAHTTDLGTRRPSLVRPLEAVTADADALLGQALASNNHDVAAELLWTWPMFGSPLSSSAAYTLDELAVRHRVRGFLPGPEYDETRHAERGDDYLILTSYHTAIVWGVLAAALIADAPPVLSTTSATADPVPLLRHADGAWADRLRSKSVDERAACVPLVLGAELRSSVARHDLVDVRRLLAWALAHGWADLPSVLQASAFLDRVVCAAALDRR